MFLCGVKGEADFALKYKLVEVINCVCMTVFSKPSYKYYAANTIRT